MIIIESQDGKSIRKVENIQIINTNRIITGYKEFSTLTGFEEYFDVLGEYKTEERAKEIMKEIEDRIRELKLIDVIKYTKDFIIDFDTAREMAIYTMPKE